MTAFGDVKLTINVYNGNGKIEMTRGGLVTDLRELVQTDEHLKAVRDYLVTMYRRWPGLTLTFSLNFPA